LAGAMSEPEKPPAEGISERVRKQRNLLIAAALLGFVVLVFFVTIAKMKAASG